MLKEENLKDKHAARNVETFRMEQGMVLELHWEEFCWCNHTDTQSMSPGGIMYSIGISTLLNQLKNQTLPDHIDWRFSKRDLVDTF